MPSAICSINVDFPIPGSPPRRMRLPGTMPPPSTRSTSLIFVVRRLTSCPLTSANDVVFAERLFPPEADPPLAETFSLELCSAIVPHFPHSKHRPDHFWLCAPQEEHSKRGLEDIDFYCTTKIYSCFFLPCLFVNLVRADHFDEHMNRYIESVRKRQILVFERSREATILLTSRLRPPAGGLRSKNKLFFLQSHITI